MPLPAPSSASTGGCSSAAARNRCCFITGGAAVKLTPITDLPFETVDTLIFEGLLLMQSRRLAL